MKSVYVGTSLHNHIVAKQVMDRFRENGIRITYDWTEHGQAFEEDDLASIAFHEMHGVLKADLFFMVQPGRTGTHIELGIALGRNMALGDSRPIVLVESPVIQLERKSFYYAPDVFRFQDMDKAFEFAMSMLR